MELKEILRQKTQQASSNLNYFSKSAGYLHPVREATKQSLNLLSVITMVTKHNNKRKSYLQARYGDIQCAIMKTPSTRF